MSLRITQKWTHLAFPAALLFIGADCALPQPAGSSNRDAISSTERPLSSLVGFYHWGGPPPGDLQSGLARLHELNARVVRLTISARMDIDYHRGIACIPDFKLPAVVEDPDVRLFLEDPRLEVLILTVYDGTGFGDCTTHNYLKPKFYTQENTARLVKEYEEFVFRLRALTTGARKQIILSNWEGDNAVYCGSAYLYVASEQFRKTCDDSYSVTYSGNRGPEDSLHGLVLWMNARYTGTALGNARADAEGIPSLPVLAAPEFSTVRMLTRSGFKSVLRDVIGRIPFDYLSYSCYESLDSADPAATLEADLDLIRSVSGTDRIILGEIGFARSTEKVDLISKTRAVLKTAIDWGVSYVIQWNLSDKDAVTDYGMFDHTGLLTELGQFYRSAMR